MASTSSASGKKANDKKSLEKEADLASLAATASAHWEKKCKGSLLAVHCTCEDARKFRLRLGRLCLESIPSEDFIETAFQVFAQQRDKCHACKFGSKRTRDKCSCKDSFNFLMSLVPPYDRPVFPTNDDIVGAEIDWMYEAERCLYCNEHGGLEEQRLQYIQKKKSQYRPVGCWELTKGQKTRIVMNDYNPFNWVNGEGSDEDDDDDDEQELDSDQDDLNFGFF